MEESRTEKMRKINYWEKLFELRDEHRANKKGALVNVLADELPWELNRQGIMRWYLHPVMKDTVINPFIFFVQEIPPGSRSGRIKTQGGQNIYIWEGKGYTVLNGVKHYWEAGDLIQLPLWEDGCIVQHFNTDQNNRVRFASVEVNSAEVLGMDRGSGFEQLENCPEYEKENDKEKAKG